MYRGQKAQKKKMTRKKTTIMRTRRRLHRKKRPARQVPLIELPTIRRYRGTFVPRTVTTSAIKPEAQKRWLCLGAPARSILFAAGITRPEQLVGRDQTFWQALCKTNRKIRPWLKDLQTMSQKVLPTESLPWSSELIDRPAEGVPRSILERAGGEYTGTERAGPTPSFNYQILQEMKAKGYDVTQVLDTAKRGKLMRTIQDGSVGTYSSHEKGIRRFCTMINAQVVPAER